MAPDDGVHRSAVSDASFAPAVPLPSRDAERWEALLSSRFIICVGSGGVGKTTVSASIAYAAARQGKRALVITIDPARRLANSLGLERLPGHEVAIASQTRGEMLAMTLDTKTVFDGIVEQFIDNPATRAQITENAFYGHMVNALSGTQEYMAVDKLFQLSQRADIDLVVLDTPPMAHALDILDAPRRMLALIDSRAFQWFVRPAMGPGAFGLWVIGKSSSIILRSLAVFVGKQFLRDLASFLAGLGSLLPALTERSAAVEKLLRGPQTRFVIVTSPAAATAAEASYLRGCLAERDMPFAGYVVNRVHPRFPGTEAPLGELEPETFLAACPPANLYASRPELAREIAAGLIENLRRYARLAAQDESVVAELATRAGGGTAADLIATIPMFPEDVHDIDGLARIAAALFDRGGGGDT
ncbi:MAG: ArsA family ATPase [Candidatus Schekmanbacteria bacterium]|nr:ArsA family ATPase [Candidatus Schekmanbacteria bacterium]